MLGTHPKQKSSIGVAISNSVFPNDTLPQVMIPSNPGIEVTQDQKFVSSWDGTDSLVQCADIILKRVHVLSVTVK